MYSIFLVLPFVSLSFALHAHSHAAEKRLPSRWYQRDDHPVHMLFKRGANTDGFSYPPVGSGAWQNSFPEDKPDPKAVPAEWTNALNAAVKAGKIPNVPQSIQPDGPDSSPSYPNNGDPNSPEICSSTYQCRGNGTIWDAPDGVFGSSFDDGPQPPTATLLDFLKQNKVTTTHFMIGQNIRQFPDLFLQAFNQGDDIAVHTYTHPYMTTLSNAEVIAELGFTMEIIRNSTGGRVPKYWRPPYGDSDNRVNAIAKEVFGLTTIIWNQDTADWSIPAGGTTMDKVHQQMTQWLTGPKSPGLIILEHELYNQTVGAFMAAFPLIQQNGWKFTPVTQLYDQKTPYQNAGVDSSAAVAPKGILTADQSSNVTSSQATSSTSPSSTTHGSGSSQPSSQTSSQTSSTTGSASSVSGSSVPSAASGTYCSIPLSLLLSIIIGVHLLTL